MSAAGYGRGYYGEQQLARVPQRKGRGWIKLALVVGAGAVVWLMWPRKAPVGPYDSPPTPPPPAPPPPGSEYTQMSGGEYAQAGGLPQPAFEPSSLPQPMQSMQSMTPPTQVMQTVPSYLPPPSLPPSSTQALPVPQPMTALMAPVQAQSRVHHAQVATLPAPQLPAPQGSYARVAQAQLPSQPRYASANQQPPQPRSYGSAREYEDAVVASARQLQDSGAKVVLAPHLAHLASRLEP